MTTRRPERSADIADVLCRVLRGDSCAERLAMLDEQAVAAVAEEHGLTAIVARVTGADPAMSATLQAALDAAAQRELVRDMAREADLRVLLDALAKADAGAILFKGAALAYTHYLQPALRPRLDSDILVPAGQDGRVRQVMARLGYAENREFTGDMISHQCTFIRYLDGLPIHAVDVHRRLTNPEVFAAALPYEELARDAVPIPALGAGARGPCPAHALIIAVLHQVAHHADRERLIWLYDLHVIATRLSIDEWALVTALADQHALAGAVRDRLIRSAAAFGTPVPDGVLADLRRGRSAPPGADAYLQPGTSHVRRVAADLMALGSWRARVRMARQHLLPPTGYMRDVYAPTSRAPLAVLYVRRAVRGARRWFQRA